MVNQDVVKTQREDIRKNNKPGRRYHLRKRKADIGKKQKEALLRSSNLIINQSDKYLASTEETEMEEVKNM